MNKSKMLAIVGIAVCGISVIFGLWAGLGWAFIGGIILAIEGFQTDPWNATMIAFGVCRVFFCWSNWMGVICYWNGLVVLV